MDPLLIEALQLLFPSQCLLCGRPYIPDIFPHHGGERWAPVPLCRTCLQELEQELLEQGCSICGSPLVSEQTICMSCRRHFPSLPSFRSNRPLFLYRGRAKELLRWYKFKNGRDLAPLFAYFFAQRVIKPFGSQITLVPVPFRSAGKRSRGWDPVETICRILSHHYGYSVAYLLKRRGNRQQKQMTAAEREGNMQKAIVMRRRRSHLSAESHYLIIDDVMTTGATLQACAAALRDSGAEKISATTIVVD